jgi:hypothetical protein
LSKGLPSRSLGLHLDDAARLEADPHQASAITIYEQIAGLSLGDDQLKDVADPKVS